MSGAKNAERGVGPRRFKPYPACRGSGVEWLGEIPAHWESLALKRIVDPTRPVTYGIVQCGPDFPDGVPYIRPVDMDDEGGIKADTLQRTSPDIAAAYARSKVRPGDIVVSIGPSFGKAMIVPPELDGANLTQGTARVAPGRSVTSRFLFWSLRGQSSRQAWDSYCSGATFRALTLEILETCAVALPPAAEQRAIVSFLDRETARIDALVAKKERLIELLQEKRNALITRAVTKGLDPDVPMKDTGVEWLGKIPAHWDVKKVKRLCLVRRGASPRPIDDPIYFDDEGEYAWVRIADVTASERYLETTTQRLSALGQSKSVTLEPGELFVSIAATVGKPIITKIKCCIHDGFVYFVGLREDREYLYYLFSCGEPYKGLGKLGTQLNLNTGTIGDIYLPRPSGGEQQAIVQFLDQETDRLDVLVAKVRDAIGRLMELRTALISAAVTGKIDVRGPSIRGER